MHKQSINELSLKVLKGAFVGVAFGAAMSLTACHGAAWKCAPKVAPVVEAPAPTPPPPAPTPPAPTPPPPPPPALCLSKPLDVYFDTDKHDIKKEFDAKLADLAKCLAKNTDQKVAALGYADLRASVQHNMKLSQRRADSVKKTLEKHGAPAAAISATGKGETEQFGKGHSREALQKNRVVLVNVSR